MSTVRRSERLSTEPMIKRARNSSPSAQQAPPTSQHTSPASFRLSSLPHLPFLKVLKFLDERAIEKMRRTSRGVNEYIVCNRHKLLARRAAVEIVRSGGEQASYHLSIWRKYDGNYDKFSTCIKKSSSTSVFLWLAKTFPCLHIKAIRLEGFSFDDLDLEEFSRALTKYRIDIEIVQLVNTSIVSDPSHVHGFLKSCRPQHVRLIQSENHKNFHLLFTDSFFSFMFTLREMYMKFGAFVFMPLTTVVKVIRAWYNGHLTIDQWCVVLLVEEISNAEQLAIAIGLPYSIDTRRITLRSEQGKIIYLIKNSAVSHCGAPAITWIFGPSK